MQTSTTLSVSNQMNHGRQNQEMIWGYFGSRVLARRFKKECVFYSSMQFVNTVGVKVKGWGWIKTAAKIVTYRREKKPLNKRSDLGEALCHTTRAGRLHVLTFNLCLWIYFCALCAAWLLICVCRGVCSHACKVTFITGNITDASLCLFCFILWREAGACMDAVQSVCVCVCVWTCESVCVYL